MKKRKKQYYRPRGKYKKLNEKERARVFVRSSSDGYIDRQVESLSLYLPNFGLAAGREVMLLLSAWLCDPENDEQSQKYWKQIKGDANGNKISTLSYQ